MAALDDTLESVNETKTTHDFLSDSSDDFNSEEDFQEDESSVTNLEEGSEAPVKTVQDQAKISARRIRSAASEPSTVVTFTRNFLSQMGMTQTLNCFQTEWMAMTAGGLVDPGKVTLVPHLYIENQRLQNQLMDARREREEYKQAGAALTAMLQKAQKVKDFHRLQHKYVVQEKNRLVEELRRVHLQCNNNTPAVHRMNDKYQAAVKQVMQVAAQRDKALRQMDTQAHQTDDSSTKQPAGRPSAGPGSSQRPTSKPNQSLK